jgi:hypothetical protein
MGRLIHGKLFKFIFFLKCDSLDMAMVAKTITLARALVVNPYTQKCQNTERFARISTKPEVDNGNRAIFYRI